MTKLCTVIFCGLCGVLVPFLLTSFAQAVAIEGPQRGLRVEKLSIADAAPGVGYFQCGRWADDRQRVHGEEAG